MDVRIFQKTAASSGRKKEIDALQGGKPGRSVSKNGNSFSCHRMLLLGSTSKQNLLKHGMRLRRLAGGANLLISP
ncbi:MAG TPA: hypothetical protein DEO49_05470 [Sutterella sp.]|nr:hypothetical protein [Sutterella sp.]